MPEEGLAWTPREQLLTFEEIERVARLLVGEFGMESIRLTGGEPTVRAGLPDLVARLGALTDDRGRRVDLAMTTNGVLLDAQAAPLRAAGLHRVNISLDTLRSDRFEAITRRNELHRVLVGIDAAVAAGFVPVKVNCVVMRGVNDDELVDLARFGRDAGVEMRFIEYMPLDADRRWAQDGVVPAREIVERVAGEFPVERQQGGVGSAPATRYRYLDGGGMFGVIPAVTDAFCGACDRIRLTSEGKLRNCLFAVDEFDLRSPLRSGADDEALCAVVQRCVSAKWAGHGIGNVNFIRPARSMSQIGG